MMVVEEQHDDRRPFPTVAVRGEGIIEVVPDEAQLIVRVTEEGRTREGALDNVRERMARLDQLLDGLEVPDDARDSTVKVGERGERDGGRWLSKGFRATARVDLTVDSVDVLGRIVSGAVQEADAEIAGPWWSLSRDHPSLTEACTAAAADARAKAVAYAEGLGASLGAPIRVVEPGVRTISPVEDATRPAAPAQAVAAAPARGPGAGGGQAVLPELDLSPGKRQVRASVEVMFRLDAG